MRKRILLFAALAAVAQTAGEATRAIRDLGFRAPLDQPLHVGDRVRVVFGDPYLIFPVQSLKHGEYRLRVPLEVR
jgi:hypothetical protein